VLVACDVVYKIKQIATKYEYLVNREELYKEYWWGVISYDLSED